MIELSTIKTLVEYGDWANGRILECAAPIGDRELDRGLEIGPGEGSLRRVLLHIWAGEDVWLRRWKEQVENAWPDESAGLPVAAISDRFAATARSRADWLATLRGQELATTQTYRDSKGTLFQATLGDMLLQGCIHSTHHRAQAVNALRRLGAAWPELDYMMRVRKPA
jgi:uncharacterized damage-inducible protein DinB